MTFRIALLSAVAVVLVSVAPATGFAQGPAVAPSMPLPLSVDLAKVPVGSWSEYRISAAGNTMTARMALVACTKRAASVETQIQGGPIAALGRTTVKMLLPLTSAEEIKPTEQVIQLGDHPPMMLPAELAASQSQTFKKLDPKKRIGTESVTVAGGTFPRAEHYRDKTSSGETVDFWISKSVLPFGLLKVKAGPTDGTGSVAMELTGHGRGAKPAITKPPQPFNPAVLLRQTQDAMPGGSAEGAGPAPGTVPSPHPGMPPTSAIATPAPTAAAKAKGKARPEHKVEGAGAKEKEKAAKPSDGKTGDDQGNTNPKNPN